MVYHRVLAYEEISNSLFGCLVDDSIIDYDKLDMDTATV